MRNIESQLEIIVLNVEDAIHAQKYGVDRLELLSGLDQGGLTPPIAVIKEVTAAVAIPVYVMVRNLDETFVYDKKEFIKILKQIEVIKKTKTTGIVFGSLNSDGTINEDQLATVIAYKGKLELTFGRAIDSTINYQEAIATLNKFTEIDYVLSSGHEVHAMEGKDNLTFAGNMLKEKVIAGAGVGPANCVELLKMPYIKKLHVGTSVRINHDIFDKLDIDAIQTIKAALKNKQ